MKIFQREEMYIRKSNVAFEYIPDDTKIKVKMAFT